MKNIENNSDRRQFLKVTSMGLASLAAGGLLRSAHGEEGKSQGESSASNNPAGTKVELLFLGTGAANWPKKYPPLNQKLSRGEVRGMSSMLVNGHILIDCGPTVLDVMKRYDANTADITDILLTHTHPDHLHADNILAIANSRDAGLGPLRFWGDPEALKQVPDSDRIEKRPVEIERPFDIDGLKITGLASNHHVDASNETCLIYLIESGATSVLYATDAAWLLTRTSIYLRKKQLDAIIWDATMGEGQGDPRIFSHNDLTMIRHMNQTLASQKVLKPDAKIILTHLAKGLHPSHEELEKRLLPEGLIPAYDGMSVVLDKG
jgi:phosphoribosyl 1,2-cyclic phosphate phosphodiesterase